jgi:hypothetical protein
VRKGIGVDAVKMESIFLVKRRSIEIMVDQSGLSLKRAVKMDFSDSKIVAGE